MCDAIEYEIMLHCLLQSKKEMEKLKVPLDIWIDSHEYTLNLKVTCVVYKKKKIHLVVLRILKTKWISILKVGK